MSKLRIFISYSHLDKDIAKEFFDYLSSHDFEVYWDENIILTGDSFEKKLKQALYSSDIYLPIITNNFEKSSFVQRELLTAIGYNSGRERPWIFPYIVYQNTIPYDLSTFLCFMGTNVIENDLKEIEIQLNKIRGTILAKQDINDTISEQLNISFDSYLNDVFEKLENNEKKNKRLAYFSYTMSALFLIMIIPFLFFTRDYSDLYNTQIIGTILLSFFNLTTITVFAALSRLMFILGKSFMVESIRNSDRIHAISFGKFYIRSYGNSASRQEIREVLGEWNIDKGSSFSTQDAKEIDPNFLSSIDLIKSYFQNKKI